MEQFKARKTNNPECKTGNGSIEFIDVSKLTEEEKQKLENEASEILEGLIKEFGEGITAYPIYIIDKEGRINYMFQDAVNKSGTTFNGYNLEDASQNLIEIREKFKNTKTPEKEMEELREELKTKNNNS